MIQGTHIIEPVTILKTPIRTEYTFEIDPNDTLEKVFDILPSNAIINKGRCGIGGTYLEVVIAKRNSIIIVPTNAIIDNKCYDSNGNLKDSYFVARGKTRDFNFTELREFMLDNSKFKKVFCTPESLRKIITCGFPTDELYRDWFILFDEAHATITDAYRKNMLDAFNFFFNFRNKAMISATPYDFSIPQIQFFDTYTIGFTTAINNVEVVSTANVITKLYQYLKELQQFPHRVHIFLNAVKGITDIIKMANLKDCSIFCKDDKENRETLEELQVYFKDIPQDTTFSKFNFYTTKYFEGWDLHDANATTIVVSDIHNITLRTGVSNKCIQAMGRNRKKSNRLIHLTNDRNTVHFESFKSIADRTFKTAESTIKSYNDHIEDCKMNACKPDEDIYRSPIKYADRIKSRDEITLNHFKVDRIVNRDYCDQEYNHLNYISQAWQQSHYKVIIRRSHVPEIPEIDKRMKVTHKIMLIAKYLDDIHNSKVQEDDYRFILAELKVDFEDIIQYYTELGFELMKSCNFEPTILREEYRKSRNIKGMKLVAEDYFLKYGNNEVSTKEASLYLQQCYTIHSIIKGKGVPIIPIKASATKLKSLFNKVTQTKNKQGENVWRIDDK
ncbi:DEAD/DEAH box helicase family protein [Pedobacter sp. GSP4]|uniref:DEAD/DEAH box helicase family protein n=1 Tax=Pedobacter sp. GSP4 TaxID=3453716 RepID=UPI003EE8EE22